MISAARQEAERLVASARTAAEEKIASLKVAVPDEMARERQRRLTEIDADAPGLTEDVNAAKRELEARARANRDAAEAKLLAAVWPGGQE